MMTFMVRNTNQFLAHVIWPERFQLVKGDSVPKTSAFTVTVARQADGSKNFAKFDTIGIESSLGNKPVIMIGNNGQPYVSNELLAKIEKTLKKPVAKMTITIDVE